MYHLYHTIKKNGNTWGILGALLDTTRGADSIYIMKKKKTKQ